MVEVGERADQFSRCAGISWASDVFKQGTVQQHVPDRLDGGAIAPAHGAEEVAVFVFHIESVQVVAKRSMATCHLSDEIGRASCRERV